MCSILLVSPCVAVSSLQFKCYVCGQYWKWGFWITRPRSCSFIVKWHWSPKLAEFISLGYHSTYRSPLHIIASVPMGHFKKSLYLCKAWYLLELSDMLGVYSSCHVPLEGIFCALLHNRTAPMAAVLQEDGIMAQLCSFWSSWCNYLHLVLALTWMQGLHLWSAPLYVDKKVNVWGSLNPPAPAQQVDIILSISEFYFTINGVHCANPLGMQQSPCTS